jgi:hypothetical protein
VTACLYTLGKTHWTKFFFGEGSMKQSLLAAVLLVALPISAQEPPVPKGPVTLKSILLEQLRSTHNKTAWFVAGNTAIDGLTAEQARWTDGKGNHSVGQLTNHLVFWNSEALMRFKGQTPPKFSGNNDETFNNFNPEQWTALVHQYDQVMTDWENAVEAADDKKIERSATTIARVGTHNAYHIGQIVFVRKEQGSWDATKGVK